MIRGDFLHFTSNLDGIGQPIERHQQGQQAMCQNKRKTTEFMQY